jgi:diacylglycerol O-acyltransferase / wax synthase
MPDELRFDQRMSDLDALMWTMEQDPQLRLTLTGLLLLDRAPDRDRLIDSFERLSREVPRFRQRVVSDSFSLAPPRWEVDPNFDLGYHMRWQRAPGGGSTRDAADVAAPVAMQAFDRARPLWEVVVVEGLADDRAAVILKQHHAMTDGITAVKMAMHLFDLERDPTTEKAPMPDAPEVRVLNRAEGWVDALRHETSRQIDTARRTARAISTVAADVTGAARRFGEAVGSIARLAAPAPQPMSPIMRARSLTVHFDTICLPLLEMKAAARTVDGTLNDAFVAAVLGGLRIYHERFGTPVDALRMAMPINTRTDDTATRAGNQFVPARFAVPVGIVDPVARMAAVRDLVREQRAEPSLALTDTLAGLLYRLPAAAATGFLGSMLKGVDFITSNVPGIPVPLYVAGGQLLGQFPFGPLSGAACNLTLLSYMDEIQVGVNVDPAAVTDTTAFYESLLDGFDEVRKVA